MLKNNFIIILSSLLISGCAALSSGSSAGIQVEPEKVEIPVAVPCKVTIPSSPAFNFDKLVVTQDIYSKTQALLADRWLHMGYEDQLLAALNSCVK